jgi:hypothetical protein
VSVTAGDSARRHDDSCNTARAERLMAEWEGPGDLEITMAFQGVDEDTARTIQTQGAMRERGVFCTDCRRLFGDGDVAYRKRGKPGWNPGPQPLGLFCHGCVSKWHSSWLRAASEPTPCAGECGVLVSGWYRYSYYSSNYEREGEPLHTTCSARCAERARNARRRKSTPTACASCGETFTPQRSDARYCSPACRQRAYRERAA